MKKNDRLELLRQGKAAVAQKLKELEASAAERALTATRHEEKNVKAIKNLRRTIAQLKTALPMLKETK